MLELQFPEEQEEPVDGWLRFSDSYETEVYINGEWILLEDYYKQQKK
jgi:hypothetical protein